MKNYLLNWEQKDKNQNIIAHGIAIINGSSPLWLRDIHGEDHIIGRTTVEDEAYCYICLEQNNLPEVQPYDWEHKENAYEDGEQVGWYIDLRDGSELLVKAVGYDDGIITQNIFD